MHEVKTAPHGITITDVELGPVCEQCLMYLPHARLDPHNPSVLCDDCRKAGL